MHRWKAAALTALLLVCAPGGAPHACTSFCMDTPGGAVFGTNLDLFIPADGLVFVNRRGVAKEGFQAGTTGKTARWVSRYGSVTFNLAGREFAWGGMNGAGLVLSSMELRASKLPEPDERPGLTIGTWAQYVLDTCGNVEEVARVGGVVRMEDSAPPSHFLIADAEGNCAVVEWLDGRFSCRTGDEVPVKAMSNMRYERALAAYESGGPRWWWSNPGRSAERFAAAEARMRGFDPGRDTDAVAHAFETLTRVVAAPHTKWNVVYDLANREVWYRSDRSPAVKHLSLGDLDFSCEGPVMMLDVNAPLEGDIRGAFGPYDHEVNLGVFRTLCARYQLDVSADAAEDLMRLFESYGCDK